MKAIRKVFDDLRKNTEKGSKYEKFYYAVEAFDTFLFTPNHTTEKKGAQIRDAIDLKRLMMTVVISMIPCLLFGIWNAGHQHYLAIAQEGTFLEKVLLGSQLVIPIVVVSYAVGLGTEFLFSMIRRHPVNEGYLVTGMLIPLIMPVTIPLWQVALATIFAVVIGKEVFGGTGMNILNVALTARAFLYFAYPSEISGDIWTYLGDGQVVDGYSGATALAIAAETAINDGESVLASLQNNWYRGMFDFGNMFWGAIPGSIGETSTLMILIGALILIVTGVGSWQIMASVFIGAYATGLLFNAFGGNAFLEMPAHYHIVMGGLAFGAVFMATDPVSASQTETGKWIYGFLIGFLTLLIRVLNPAYPEGIMLAILLMNVFAPLIDYYIVQANKKRRLQRATV
jgi:Na+-transporting NADH:ubiquinone oxidoreductase subunit B